MNVPIFKPLPLAAAIVATFAAPTFASVMDEAGTIITLRELEEVSNHSFGGHDVAALPGGGFAVVWAEAFNGTDHDNYVRLQRFDASGNASGDELTLFQRNQNMGTSRFSQPAVAADEDGDLVVAWTTPGNHCYGSLYIQTLQAHGDWANLPEPTEVTERGCAPRLAMDPDGDFALTWRDNTDHSASQASALLRTYSANGTPYQSESITLVHNKAFSISTPVLAIQPHGVLKVAWENIDNSLVYGQRFNLTGTTLDATPKRLDNGTSEDDYFPQQNPALVAYGNDGFVAFWDEREPYPTSNVDKVLINGQRWHGDGTAGRALFAGDVLSAGQSFARGRTAPATDVDSDGNLLVAWQGQISGERSHTGLTHFDDRLHIAELNVPFVEPEDPSDSFYTSPPSLVMSDDRAVLVWVQRDEGEPLRLQARILATLVEEDSTDDGTGDEGDSDDQDDTGNTDESGDDADSDNASETGGSKSSGGSGSLLTFLLAGLAGASRWVLRSRKFK